MPEKKADERYDVTGKTFTWHPDVEDGEDQLPDVVLPLRLKIKVIREMNGVLMDAEGQADFIGRLVPAHVDTLEEMDVNDLSSMFAAWQEEYQKLGGATVPE